jgi:hypothetical protein
MERIPLHSWEMEFSIQYHDHKQPIKRSEFNTVLYKIYLLFKKSKSILQDEIVLY